MGSRTLLVCAAALFGGVSAAETWGDERRQQPHRYERGERFNVEVGGVTHLGAWVARPTGAVEVRSSYGNVSVHSHGRAPADVARATLMTMVESRHTASWSRRT